MNKVIAFSLYGTVAKYCDGAIENIALAKILYPGWVCRFYIANDVPDNIVDELVRAGAVIVRCGENKDRLGSFWRFNVVLDESVDVFVIRDCDSRLNIRERSAVDDFLLSDKIVHIMRDHPHHTKKMNAGMWGAKLGAINSKWFYDAMDQFMKISTSVMYGGDEEFLDSVYQVIKDVAMVHDDRNLTGNDFKFDVVLSDNHFVGEVIG